MANHGKKYREAVAKVDRAKLYAPDEAIDMVKGGIDGGVFGYCALVVHDDRCLVTLKVAEPAAAARSSK